MEGVSSFTVEPSSNPDGVAGLKDSKKSEWQSDKTDKSPSVAMTINDVGEAFIEYVTFTETDNVKSITVSVFTADGSKVSCLNIFSHLQFIFSAVCNECP